MEGSRVTDNRRWNGDKAGGSHARGDISFEIPISGERALFTSRYTLLLGMGDIQLNLTARL